MVPRRDSLQAGGAAAFTALSYQHIAGANDRVRMGFIGYGLIGKRHVVDCKEQPDVAITVLSDCCAPQRDAAASFIGGAKTRRDFRRLLDTKDVDARPAVSQAVGRRAGGPVARGGLTALRFGDFVIT